MERGRCGGRVTRQNTPVATDTLNKNITLTYMTLATSMYSVDSNARAGITVAYPIRGFLLRTEHMYNRCFSQTTTRNFARHKTHKKRVRLKTNLYRGFVATVDSSTRGWRGSSIRRMSSAKSGRRVGRPRKPRARIRRPPHAVVIKPVELWR